MFHVCVVFFIRIPCQELDSFLSLVCFEHFHSKALVCSLLLSTIEGSTLRVFGVPASGAAEHQVLIGRVRKIAVEKGRPSTCDSITGRSLAPLSLTTQVPDQRMSTGQLPEWSDSGTPAQVGTCNLPVIKWQVLVLLFSTAIFRTLPIA